MATDLRFDGRVAIVTGAGRGIGRSHAHSLAARGAKVVVNDLGGAIAGGGKDESVAEAVAEEISSAGGEAIANSDSVAADGGAESLVQTALDAYGRVDVLINNAGIFETRPLAETDVANFAKHVQTNLIGSAATCFAVWPHMLQAGYGRIVNTQSTAGVLGMLERVSYGASKTGIIGLTRCLAHEGEGHGIMVNLVNPSARTRMWIDESTGEPWPDVPKAPAAGTPDRHRPELVSPMFVVLAHESCPANGEMYDCFAGGASKQFFGTTAGIFDEQLTAEDIAGRWTEVTDESGYFVPTILKPYRGM